MVTTFSMILSLGFNVYFFPIYHIMSGLRAIFFLKNLKAGLCLIIGGSILEAVAYYGFYSAETIPWLQQSAGLLWLLGGIPCYIGIYLINKKNEQSRPCYLYHPHHMLRPRTHRCNQLNLNQQRLVRESFPF